MYYLLKINAVSWGDCSSGDRADYWKAAGLIPGCCKCFLRALRITSITPDEMHIKIQ